MRAVADLGDGEFDGAARRQAPAPITTKLPPSPSIHTVRISYRISRWPPLNAGPEHLRPRQNIATVRNRFLIFL